MLYIGIDHHKNHSTFTCVNQRGDIIKTQKLYNSKQEIESFLALLNNSFGIPNFNAFDLFRMPY